MVSNEVLINSYSRTGNVWKTAAEVGLCGQSVHERLTKLGVIKKMNLWTSSDDKVLIMEYKAHKDANTLDELALRLGRTKQFICRKARALGLTDKKNKVMAEKTREKLSESTRSWIAQNGHPRGYLGHKHSAETLSKLSYASRSSWSDPNSKVNSAEFRQRMSDNLHERKMSGSIRTYSNRGDYPVVIGGMAYVFKSSWEVEVAKRLHELSIDGCILGWNYESMHFNFDDMKRGTRSYCPDFEVKRSDGSIFYIEVKGWKMERSMERIRMFQERYPDVELYIIDDKEYGKILSEGGYLRGRCIEE